MLWPGNLIVASDRFPQSGVFIYALMAAGGDFGAAVVPQMTGFVTDAVMSNSFAAEIAQIMSMTVEQFGMKAGMLAAGVAPLAATVLHFYIYKKKETV